MGTVGCWIETDCGYPRFYNPCVLPRRTMRRTSKPAFECVIVVFQLSMSYPLCDGIGRLFRKFKLNGLLGFLLHDPGSLNNLGTVGNIANPVFNQITAS